MKILTKEDLQKHNETVLRDGLKGGAIGLALSSIAMVAGTRYKVRAIHSLTTPLKGLGIVSTTVSGFLIAGERASRRVELDHIMNNATLRKEAEEGVHFEKLAGIGSGLTPQEESERREAILAHLSRTDRTIEWMKDHKWSIIMGGWASSLVASFGYIATTPLSFSHKLVQARMYAQTLTVVLLIAAASMSNIKTGASEWDEGEEEKQRKRDAAYRWAKNSPHELKERHRREEIKEHERMLEEKLHAQTEGVKE